MDLCWSTRLRSHIRVCVCVCVIYLLIWNVNNRKTFIKIYGTDWGKRASDVFILLAASATCCHSVVLCMFSYDFIFDYKSSFYIPRFFASLSFFVCALCDITFHHSLYLFINCVLWTRFYDGLFLCIRWRRAHFATNYIVCMPFDVPYAACVTYLCACGCLLRKT